MQRFGDVMGNKFAPRGIVLAGGTRQSLNPDELALPYMSGGLSRFGWDQCEPSPGQYDFSGILGDAAIAQGMGKFIVGSILDGPCAPPWLYDKGARKFTANVKTGDGTTTGKVNIPVPWDSIYLDAKKQLIEAMGKALDWHPAIPLMHCTVSSMNGLEFSLPEVDQVTGQSLFADWARIGYTSGLLASAHQEVITQFAANFKYSFLDCDIHNVFGNTMIPIANINWGRTVAGPTRFGSYGGWLSGSDYQSDLFPVVQMSGQLCACNFQLIGNYTTQPQRFPQGIEGALRAGLAFGSHLIEVWGGSKAKADSWNQAAVLTSWNQRLRNL
jgi:hypothetical protein